MKRWFLAGLLALVLVGCGGGTSTTETSAATSADSATSAAESSEDASTATASSCTAGGLDAMTALADFQLEMDEAQKSGKITQDQLLAPRQAVQRNAGRAGERGLGSVLQIDRRYAC
jgi:PBP1b-binding outer membrane lipoprotein LpoB